MMQLRIETAEPSRAPQARAPHAGASVAECLRRLHEHMRPDAYLQIGGGAETIEAASCATLLVAAAASEPVPIGRRPSLMVFQDEPRTFFTRRDPTMLLGRPVDLAFLDGLPLFEEVLWSFAAAEQASREDGVIVLNNCLPLDVFMAGRDPADHARRRLSSRPDWWTGDAWKVIALLLAERPDLTLRAVDASPAGLIAVSGLDPGSRVLADRFDALVEAYRDPPDEAEALEWLWDAVAVQATDELVASAPARPSREVAQVAGRRFRFTDLSQLATLEPASLLRCDRRGRHAEEPDGVRSFHRAAPEFIDDPSRQGIITPFGNDTIRSRAAGIAALQDFWIVGYRSILTDDGMLLHDEPAVDPLDGRRLAQKLARADDDFLNEQTGLSQHGDGFTIDWRDREVVEIDEPVVVLCSNEPSNHGSWIYRTLPKLQIVRSLALEGSRILVYAPQRIHLEYFEALGLSPEMIVQHDPGTIYRIRRGFVPSVRTQLPFLDPAGRELFASLRRNHGRTDPTRLIYVSRLGWSAAGRSVRVLQNEAELAAAMAAAGFDVVEPEGLSLPEQIEIFSSARMVVGPAGSALYNTVFCHPGTRIVDIESEPQWVPLHSCLFASLGHPYGIFVGAVDPADSNEVHRRWSVDVPALMRRIKAFGGR